MLVILHIGNIVEGNITHRQYYVQEILHTGLITYM